MPTREDMDVQTKHSEPPELQHITTNIVPLSSILDKFAQFAYAELSHVLKMQPNDDDKKKKLLDLLVYLRTQFTRLYVLTNWSHASAHDFNKFIDLLAWLREQSSHFGNLIWSTKSLNQSLLSAKLPNPDLITAMEVLSNGRPTLPTHNFIETRISPQKVLQTLRDLNVVLSMKYALVDDLPEEFTDYDIKDGRIYVYTKDYQFQISALDESTPFFMIDFELSFGKFEKAKNLIRVCNEALRSFQFVNLKRILTNYTMAMKLYLIHQKLNELKTVKHTYSPEKFQITVHYWMNSFVFKYSRLEIGLNKNNEIIYRWFKQGQLAQTFEQVDHIDMFLRDIYHKHSTSILSQIEDLMVNKSLLQINELTGIFYFKNPTPALNMALKKLNVDDFKNINENLQAIRTDLKFTEISSVLSVTGWIPNDLIKLPQVELSKLYNGVRQEPHRLVRFYTRKEWAQNWFLIFVIDTKIRTFIGNIRSVLGQWTLNAPSEVCINSFDYKSSKDVINQVSKKIMTHLISQELTGTNYHVVSHDSIVVETESFVKIPNASKVVMLMFRIDPTNKNNIVVNLKGKLNKIITLDDFIVDSNGVFQIFETIDFKRANILTNIMSKLTKLAKVIELVDYLQKRDMELVSVQLDQVVFKYGDNVCTLKENFDLELPKENPHNICLSSIRRFLVTNGVDDVFKYLMKSNVLISKLNDMSNQAQVDNVSSWNVDKLRYEIISKNATYFSVLYYSNKFKPRHGFSMNIEIKNGALDSFVYLISIDKDDLDANLKRELTSQGNLFKNRASTIKYLVPLSDGIVCDDSGLNYVLDQLHSMVLDIYNVG